MPLDPVSGLILGFAGASWAILGWLGKRVIKGQLLSNTMVDRMLDDKDVQTAAWKEQAATWQAVVEAQNERLHQLTEVGKTVDQLLTELRAMVAQSRER